MKISKQRVESFSDGVIAIIVTIMVLNIPLPNTFTFNKIMVFINSIFVFFVSFFIVASQWNKHRYFFDKMEEVTDMIIWRNFLFLFFLSLMPIFTKWVIENPDQVVPAIGYDLLFLLVTLSYMFMFRCGKDKIENIEEKEFRKEGKFLWILFISAFGFITAIFIFSFYYPRISIIFFIGLPVASSLLNLLFDNRRNEARIRRKSLVKKLKNQRK